MSNENAKRFIMWLCGLTYGASFMYVCNNGVSENDPLSVAFLVLMLVESAAYFVLLAKWVQKVFD